MNSYIELRLGDDNVSPRVRIELATTISSMDAVLDDLIKPALLAAGFHQETVNKLQLVEEEAS